MTRRKSDDETRHWLALHHRTEGVRWITEVELGVYAPEPALTEQLKEPSVKGDWPRYLLLPLSSKDDKEALAILALESGELRISALLQEVRAVMRVGDSWVLHLDWHTQAVLEGKSGQLTAAIYAPIQEPKLSAAHGDQLWLFGSQDAAPAKLPWAVLSVDQEGILTNNALSIQEQTQKWRDLLSKATTIRAATKPSPPPQ